MSANRKLLAEIQQVLKKVEEGIQVFDEIWEKVYAAEQQSLKEKYESDLKKEIKKLQRLRDQIKTWIGGNDIKDKTQLIEARKSIETKMEQFKVCEKDTKTKAYSKEGLARDVKQDPKDILRGEKRGWVNECIDKLNDLINSVEVEREKLLGGKGSKKAKEQQLERIENRIQKHKWHIVRLELIIKLLDSEDLDPSNLEVIEDSLEYYLESAVDDDGALGVEDEFDIYEELELESLGAADATFDIASHAANAPTKDESEAPIKQVETVATPAIDSHADAATSNKGKKGSTSVTGSSTTVKVAASPAATAAVISGKSVSNKASSSSVPAAGKTSKQQQKDAQVAVEDSAAPTKKSGTALKTAAAATAADATSETKPTAVTGTPMSWATAAGNAPAPTASNAAEAVASSNAAGTNTNPPPAPEKPSPSTSMPAAPATVAAVESAEGAKGKTVTSQASALAPSTAGIATTAVTVVAQTGKSIHVPEGMAPPTANSATPGAGAETFSAPPAGSTVLSSQPSVVTRSPPTMPTPAPDGLALPQPPPLQQLNPEMMVRSRGALVCTYGVN